MAFSRYKGCDLCLDIKASTKIVAVNDMNTHKHIFIKIFGFDLMFFFECTSHLHHHNGLLARYVNLRVAHAPGTVSPPPRVSDPDMHHGTCVTHVLWCMPGSLTSGFLWSWWRRKRSRHSRRMCNTQVFVSGKRPTDTKWAGHASSAFGGRVKEWETKKFPIECQPRWSDPLDWSSFFLSCRGQRGSILQKGV